MTNYERIKNASVDEMVEFINNISKSVMNHCFCQSIKVENFPYSCEDTEECCIKHIKQWLETEEQE